jgi:hypothetical protein
MVQLRCGLRFTFKPTQHFFISRQMGWKKLQSNMTTQAGMKSQVNMPHASRAQVLQNAIRA